jgi:hypothetical protein
MPNFKSHAKRKRELAKLDKRQAKDQKRAVRRAERAGADPISTTLITAAAQTTPSNHHLRTDAPPARRPLTLAEAVERWRNTKVVKPKRR